MKLSYSSVNTLRQCGEKYRLGRVLGYRGRPSWAQLGGTIFHTAIENYERENLGLEFDVLRDPRRNWGLALDEAATEIVAGTDFTVEDIRPTGRAVKSGNTPAGGPNKKDRDWWVWALPSMYESYLSWTRAVPYPIWIAPDGEPGLEIHFEFTNPRGDLVRGFIDQVREMPNGLLVVDAKTGKEPDSADQLGLYRLGLLEAYGVTATHGAFYLAGEARSTSLMPLGGYTAERLNWEYAMAAERVERGDFQPSIGQQCGWCDLREWCIYMNGEKSGEVQLPWPTAR